MLNLKEMSIEELNNLIKGAKEELAKRNNKKVIYTCDAKEKSEYALKKYKNWAKVLKSIDTTKTNGYAFVGDFLNVRTENLVNAGAYILELVDDNNYYLYRALENNEKELVLEGKKTELITFINKSAEFVN